MSLRELYEKSERNFGNKSEFKVKKTKTEEFKEHNMQDICDEKLKSLDKLKSKINRLKSELTYGIKL